MKQTYHTNATTNIRLRTEISNSKEGTKTLATHYNVSEKTIKKWKSRADFTDKSSRPHTIHYALNEMEQFIAKRMRVVTWWSLDEITEIINPEAPLKIRSAVYRTFKREGINKIPESEKVKAKKFKEYDPGYLHMDVTYLPKINGIKYYLFVAIDRATRTIYYNIYDEKSSANTEHFMLECLSYFPFGITHVLTDNGLEFTNRFIKNKKGEYTAKLSKLDVICKKENIDHRCTQPFTPKTNGMVEKANDTIKRGTIKKSTYASYNEMKMDLLNFLVHYNLYRRHGSLRKELNVKTPMNAVEKWYEMDPEIFKESPDDFKQKILNLKNN